MAVTGRTVFMYYSQDSLSPPHAQVHPRDHDLLVLGELRMGIIVFAFLRETIKTKLIVLSAI